MITGLLIWFAAIFNEVMPSYISFLGDLVGESGVIIPVFGDIFPAIGAALAGTVIVFVVTIVVSLLTDEPSDRIKRIVRQCHSPKPMSQQESAEHVVDTDTGNAS